MSALARYDFYGPIHKALRLGLSTMLLKLGQTDFADASACGDTLAALRHQLAISAGHLQHEDEHIHGPLEARSPGGSEGLEAAHRHHDAAFVELEALAAQIESAEPEARAAVARELYLRFSMFVAEDFAHMAEEELVTMPLLHALFSDDELMAMEAAILAGIGPEEGIAVMRLMLPAMNRPERLGFLAFARESSPPEMFEALIQFAAKPALPREEWTYLSEGLGLAA